MSKTKVAVLGATGMVGQRFVKLLSEHPWFELAAVTGSSSSIGKKYGEVVNWRIEGGVPEKFADMKVVGSEVDAIKSADDIDIVFSALPSEVAAEVEPKFANAGYGVVSDAAAFRMEKDVPILVAEVNPEHLEILKVQRANRKWSGFIVPNPNCTTTALILPLKPIFDKYGIKKILVSTMQAISGAGYDGVPSMAILDNIIPYIAKEEWKVENEAKKILGIFKKDHIEPADFAISASCHRVLVYDGHTEAVFLELAEKATPEEIIKAMEQFKGKPQKLKLPSAPENPIIVRKELDRPQPRLDRDAGNGMAAVVGRVREDPALPNGIKFVTLGHNTVRGAAGGAILTAELILKEGYL